MNKIFTTLTAGIITMFAMQGQEFPEPKHDNEVTDKHPNKMHHHRFGMAFQKLNITDAQKEEIKALRENFRKQINELRKNENITVKEWKETMQNLRKEQKTKMENILTEEQIERMRKRRDEIFSGRKKIMERRACIMKEKLGLSHHQSAKLDTYRTELAAKMKALREDKNLSDEQRKEKAKELIKEQKENIKSVLTEEQLKKLKEIWRHISQAGDRKHKANKVSV